ncbi:hypothetical protein BH10PAT2_BH10PAT2_1510 [soil metagenome]
MKRQGISERNSIKKKETSKVLLIAIFGLGIILVAVFLFLLAFFKRSWLESSDRNILLLPQTVDGYTGKILFAHISPTNHKIDVVMLNPELSVNVIGGYEQYPLRSIYPLWELEKRDTKILPAIYSFALSKVVDQVWLSDKSHFDPNSPNFAEITQNILFFKITTPLTLGDRIWLYKFTQTLRPDQIKVTTVETMTDWQKLQSNILFGDQSSACNFAIINTIGISGAGSTVGKMLENSGFSIVRITDESPMAEKTELILGDKSAECQDQQDHTLNALPLSPKIIHDTTKANQYRANMVLILGKDMAAYFGQKVAP